MPRPKRTELKSPTSTDPRVRAFLAYLATERGLSANTLSAYAQDLSHAEKYLAARGRPELPADPDDLRAFLRSESRRGRASRTVARRLAGLRVFLKYLRDHAGLDTDPHLAALERPKLERSLPKVLSADQVRRLIAAPAPTSPRWARDVAILELLYAAGLRASELCDLRRDAVDWMRNTVRVKGKGAKERVVPFGLAARAALDRYLSELGDAAPARGPLFASRTGRPLDRVALYALVRRHAAAAGLVKAVSPHTLRHCFASHLVAGGADLRVVQDLLGHADVATTQVYTHVDHGRLKLIHRQHHPRG